LYKFIVFLFFLTNVSNLIGERRYDKVKDSNTQHTMKVYWNGVKIKKFKNGTTKKSRTYKDGYLDGPTIKYNRKGVKISIKQYKNDKLDGLKSTFRKDGSLRKTEPYSNGKLHGKTVRYRKDGKTVKKTANYQNGQRIGLQKEFHRNGSLKSQTVFRIGAKGKEQRHGAYVAYYKDKKLRYEVEYVNGKKHGIAKMLHPNGIVGYIKCYINGKKQAGNAVCNNQKAESETITRKYANGKPSLIYQVKNGKRHGMYRRYDKEGKLTSATRYDEGKKMSTKKY